MSRIARLRMRPVPMVTAPKRANCRPGGGFAYYRYYCHRRETLPHGHTLLGDSRFSTTKIEHPSFLLLLLLLLLPLRRDAPFREGLCADYFLRNGIEVANRISSLGGSRCEILKRIVIGEFEASVCWV